MKPMPVLLPVYGSLREGGAGWGDELGEWDRLRAAGNLLNVITTYCWLDLKMDLWYYTYLYYYCTYLLDPRDLRKTWGKDASDPHRLPTPLAGRPFCLTFTHTCFVITYLFGYTHTVFGYTHIPIHTYYICLHLPHPHLYLHMRSGLRCDERQPLPAAASPVRQHYSMFYHIILSILCLS